MTLTNRAVAPYRGFHLEEISDLSGVDEAVIAGKWSDWSLFTLGEAAAIAPHLGMSVDEFVGEALA